MAPQGVVQEFQSLVASVETDKGQPQSQRQRKVFGMLLDQRFKQRDL